MSLTQLKSQTAPAPNHGFVGLWRAIEWQPDLFNPQRFVVGVLVESGTQRTSRLMDAANRFECFFRPDPVARDFAWLMSNARRCLAENGTLFGHNLTLSDGLFIQGESIETTADALFDQVVLAARPTPESQRAESVGPDTDEVRKNVADALKLIFGMSYEQVAREQGQTLSDHHLDVTLAPNRGAGSVISACYRTPSTIETKLLRAARDINAYASSLHKDAKAIFMQMPAPDAALTAKERADIERLTGEEAWKLECNGFTVPRHHQASALAREIRDWATPLL